MPYPTEEDDLDHLRFARDLLMPGFRGEFRNPSVAGGTIGVDEKGNRLIVTMVSNSGRIENSFIACDEIKDKSYKDKYRTLIDDMIERTKD